MTPRLRRVILLALLAAAVAWQLMPHRGASAGHDSALVVTRAAPDELLLGRLHLEPCDIGKPRAGAPTLRAYCTSVAVPEDWSHPAGRAIHLKVAVVRADAAQPDPDPVVFLDGGPGGAASDDYPGVAGAFDPLRKRHWVLLVDQRGTGGSNALDCDAVEHADQATDRSDAPPLPAGPPGGIDAQRERAIARSLEHLRACVATLAARAAPGFYTTSAAVRDLEAVRQALGAPRLDLLGVSYGTRMAQQYARTYPQAVRAVVLDSPVPDDLPLGSEHARNLEAVLQALAARCRAESACAQRFGDPYQTLYRVRGRLQSQPQSLELRDPYTFKPGRREVDADGLAQLMRFYAYSPLTAALVPYVLSEADRGDYAPLLGQTELVVGDVEDHITGGMSLSVLCAEDVDLLRAAPADEGTLMRNDLTRWLLGACEVWPHGVRPPGFREPLRGDLPVLVLAGERDPVTPPRYATQIARTLTRARVLQLRGQGHAQLGVGCVPRLVEEFLRTLAPQALDASCLEALGDTPFFIDANGPPP